MAVRNTFYFHQEIAGDGLSSSRRQTGFALDSFFIRKLQVMDVFFEETDWLCSPGTSGLREIAGDGQVLRGARLALLSILFSSGNCRCWTFSLRRQTGFALLFYQEIAGDGRAV